MTGRADHPGDRSMALADAPRRLRRRRAWIVCGALVVVIAGFAGLDRWFYESVARRLCTPSPVDADFYHVTKPFWNVVRLFPHVLGGSVAYLCVLALRRHGWRRANLAMLAVAIAAVGANLAQDAIGRLRPDQADSATAFAPLFAGLRQRTPVGFPSGEVATAFAMAGALRREFRKLGWMFYALAGLVVVTRVLFGMHYASDAAAGAVFGWWVEMRSHAALLLMLRRWRSRNRASGHSATTARRGA